MDTAPAAGSGAAVASDADPAEGAPASIESLQAELAAARDEVGQFRSKYLRAEADMQNYRKAVDRQRLEAQRAFRHAVLGRFLPAIDNLERALQQGERETVSLDALREGVRLTHRGLLDALAAEGVKPIEATGAPFDPHYHEAIGAAPGGADVAPNTVIGVVEQGYTIDGTVLRPARVVVAG